MSLEDKFVKYLEPVGDRIPNLDCVESWRKEARSKCGCVLHALGYRFPLETREVFFVLHALGYKGDRDTYRYLTQNEFLKKPDKDGRCLVWLESDVIAFAAELERRRMWLPYRHVGKKTVFELQSDAEKRQGSCP